MTSMKDTSNLTRLFVLSMLSVLILSACSQASTPLDFDHPRLHELAAGKPLIILDVARTEFNKTSYVAVIIGQNPTGFTNPTLLVFRLDTNGPVLISELRHDEWATMFFDSEYLNSELLKGDVFKEQLQSGFADRNHNGLPDLAVRVSNGGNCYDCGSLLLLELTKDGGVRDITPVSAFNPNGLADIDGDGTLEVATTRFYEFGFGSLARAGSPYALRLYKWNPQFDAYEEASQQFTRFYDGQINQLRNEIVSTYGQPLWAPIILPKLASVLFHYEVTGRLLQGWGEVQSSGRLENWDTAKTKPDYLELYHEVFDDLRIQIQNGSVIERPKN
jgi:hypothetical protein